MNLEDSLTQILQLITSLDPRAAALLFMMCAIGEFVIPLPYLLESVWLLAGYQFGTGAISPFYLVGLWLVAQGGRQTGSIAIYYIGRFGSIPLVRLYHQRRLSRFIPRVVTNSKLRNRVNLLSPFSVAFGRLFGLRIPITLALAVGRKLKMLVMGVLISSVIWDGIYIALGITVGATAVLKPIHMLFASLGGLTIIYLLTFIIRRFIRRLRPASDSVPGSPGDEEDKP